MKVKKLLSFLLLTTFSLVSAASSVSAEAVVNSFSDVAESHVNYEAIDYLRDLGVVEGYKDGTYKPSNTINRAEFLKILMVAGDYETGGANCYNDVKESWFSEYVCKATELTLVEGYSDGTFKPGNDINFAEASKIVANTLKIEIPEDTSDIWYKKYVEALENYDAIPTSIKGFDHKVTRGEMAEIVWRVLEKPTYVSSLTYETVGSKVAAVSRDAELVSFSTCAELGAFVEENKPEYDYRYYDLEEAMPVPMAVADATAGAATSEAPKEAAAADDYSSTNVQVAGVDEADIVKNDGKYIYYLKGDTVRIIEAYPAGGMKELDRVEFDDTSFYPSDMYVDENRLVVTGYSYDSIYRNYGILESEPTSYYYYDNVTKVYIFNITDRENIELLRQLSFEGNYSTSRKVDNTVYVVLNKPEYYYDIPVPYLEEDIVPLYADSSTEKIAPITRCGDVLIPPVIDSTNYLMVVGIPVGDAGAAISEKVILGSSGNVYASRDNMYVSESVWDYWYDDGNDEETIIHKFALDPKEIEYLGKGTVPGTILNQFSMDEYKGDFRIATTLGDVWDTENPSTNNLYILDEDLKQIGEIEGIAPGEKIYSVRFMGDRAYMVTFKKVDPFFVIDVSDPTNPAILGKLKIPGYSDYLHPYDENHIIGFGKEAIDASEEEVSDRDLDFAWYQGMKIAMFDVTDVNNPIELHKVVIGDRGTTSDLLYNHKALLFDKTKGLMAFPITVAEIPEEVKNDPDTPDYTTGDYIFQGAYVYSVSIDDGFELKGTLTHYDTDELADKAGYYWYGDSDIQRVLYIGEYLYTVSQSMVMANKMDDLSEVKSVELEN